MTPTIDDVRAAAERIRPEAVRTPLLTNPALDALVGGRVLLKCETLQRTGSFKFRGAYNAIAALSEAERARGIVACSSGNHAQGVAAAAALFGVPATIVMPDEAPQAKLDGTRRLGATVVTYRRADQDRDAMANAIVAETGARLVHPYNDPMVIAGQGTIGLEIAEALAERGEQADAVLVPCGGGGMSAGIGLAIRALAPATAVHLVEPEDFDDYGRSLAVGTVLANPRSVGSVCDALMAAQPGAIGFAINRQTAAGALSVSDDDALRAVAFAFRTLKLVVEPGGAVGLAALLAGRFDARGRTVVVVLSGGNIDPAVLTKALATG
ncbi:threonine/serine dehydratase [Kaistia dalseonensis]|uniref:Threonine dehydratase n=1 Tax=Kaistia dalseonensis TaxID=410840 RepID=A0ABU0H3Q2_9HYPH|nr:threonine/serine dehydratase [Kaistia dalseonensis]MCX5493546.1 threonine/serine dehydratase [Kaistia dalseonensis]MDQ0436106.1 threonine dehydratase [Kaistia dalseonensis]